MNINVENKKIFWLASFPKSGNTWLRLILCGLFFTKDGRITDLNILNKIPGHDNLSNFKFVRNISLHDYKNIFNNNDYNEASILSYSKYWIENQKRTKINYGNFGLFKTHNARININNNYYTNSETTAGFIYIIRDPRDIVLSYSRHINKNIDDTIDYILNGQIMEKKKINNKMPEITLNWKDHYLSWRKFSSDVPSLFLKYEDLLENFDLQIKKIINFFSNDLGIHVDSNKLKIQNIKQTTNFDNLKQIELDNGFAEDSGNYNFFRKGTNNQWVNELNTEQKNKINNAFSKEIKKFGYLP